MDFTVEKSRAMANGHANIALQKGRRRAGSRLGADIRGDTSAPAFSTMEHQSSSSSMSSSSSSDSLQKGVKSHHPRRRKAKSLLRRWKSLSYRHTWINPLVIILIVLAGYAINPTVDNPFHSAIFLSYPLPRDLDADPLAPTQYGKGKLDFAFMAFYIVVLSFTREFIMQVIIRPMAARAGFHTRNRQSRVMEQVYTAMYFGIFGPYGLYCMSRSPIWYFNTTAMFEDYPHRHHEGLFKAYYLLQASYWAQQAIVLGLNLEKPRKDYKELVGHHIVTLSLIGLSYRFHFMYIGLAVYITHDVSDFFLATSKTLNYLDSPFVGPYFFMFCCVWVYGRHYQNLRILYAILTEFRTVGPFELNWETQQYKCWISQIITFTLLACLQAVNLFWFFLVARIAKNYAFNSVRKDDRSDDEEDEDEDEDEEIETEKLVANGHATNGSAVNGDLKKDQ